MSPRTAALLYRWMIRRFPWVAPLYRCVAHREGRPPFRRRYAVASLHTAITREFGKRRGGFFFEAGANDGILFSNTAYLERYCGWRGILVEAVPHKFVSCRHNRRNSIVEHCALVPFGYQEPSVELLFSDLMSFAPYLSKIDPVRQLATGEDFLLGQESRLSGESFFAPAKTIADVIAKHAIRHIDLMSLDLEGAEIAALRGMDFESCSVDNILIEVRDLRDTDEFLMGKGFKRHSQFDHRDYLYKRS